MNQNRDELKRFKLL